MRFGDVRDFAYTPGVLRGEESASWNCAIYNVTVSFRLAIEPTVCFASVCYDLRPTQ